MRVGTVRELWSYPVKSLGGEVVPAVAVDRTGQLGDRNWALIDAQSGDLLSGKSLPGLMHLSARYVEARPGSRVYGAEVPAVEVSFPDGRAIRGAGPIGAAVSESCGRELHLHPLEEPGNLDHYRLSEPLDEARIAAMFDIKPGEAGPDLSDYDMELLALLTEFGAPPGTYYDMFPLHLLTSASVEHMGSLSGACFDRRRFRPNLYVETVDGLSGLVEFEWVGRKLRVGEAELLVGARTIRCSMPARAQEQYGLAPSPATAKALYETTNRYLGVYLSVLTPGAIREGDEVSLL
jgi:uncharacterized protein YcbX